MRFDQIRGMSQAPPCTARTGEILKLTEFIVAGTAMVTVVAETREDGARRRELLREPIRSKTLFFVAKERYG